MGNESLSFLFFPVSAGAGVLVLYALFFNRIICKREYPSK